MVGCYGNDEQNKPLDSMNSVSKLASTFQIKWPPYQGNVFRLLIVLFVEQSLFEFDIYSV